MDYIESLRRKTGHDEVIAVGAGVFPVREGKVLLPAPAGTTAGWSMHGGSLKIGETPEEAARREFYEETGLTAEDLTLLGAFSGPDTRYTYPTATTSSSWGSSTSARAFPANRSSTRTRSRSCAGSPWTRSRRARRSAARPPRLCRLCGVHACALNPWRKTGARPLERVGAPVK